MPLDNKLEIPQGLPEHLKPRKRFGAGMIVGRRVLLPRMGADDGDVLTWNSASGKWEPEAPQAGTGGGYPAPLGYGKG